MSEPSDPIFGKRQPADPAPRKRSEGVRLKLMAGAGAAALGLYAVSPSGSCVGSRYYESREQCLADGRLDSGACMTGFAQTPSNRQAGMLFRTGYGSSAVPVTRREDGSLVTPEGTALTDALSCSGSRRSSSYHGGGHGWGFGSWGSSSSSSSSVGSGSSDGGHGSSSSGGFGSSGHGFSGGS